MKHVFSLVFGKERVIICFNLLTFVFFYCYFFNLRLRYNELGSSITSCKGFSPWCSFKNCIRSYRWNPTWMYQIACYCHNRRSLGSYKKYYIRKRWYSSSMDWYASSNCGTVRALKIYKFTHILYISFQRESMYIVFYSIFSYNFFR